MKKYSKIFKAICLAISALFILSSVPFSASATDTTELKAISLDNDRLHDVVSQSTGRLPDELLQNLSLRDSDIPEAMEHTDVRETEAVARVKAREDDKSSVIYVNRDGTYTEYFFSEDVKYEKDGAVYDKSNKLTSSLKRGGYVNEENDINVTLPFLLTELGGVRLSHKEHGIESIPLGTGRLFTAASKTNDNTVIYENAFGDGIGLEYSAQFSGVKENIILSSDRGVYSFSFKIKTNGLYLEAENGHAAFCDEKGEIKADIGELYIFDAEGKPGEGSFTVEEIASGEEYIYTVTVSEDFIKSADTVFPVTIDPTITYNADPYNIITVGVTSSSVTYYHTTFSIGTLSSTTTRMAVRFDFLKDRIGQLINAYDNGIQSNTAIINSVNLKILAIKNSPSPISATISAYQMTQYWNEVYPYSANESYAIYTGYNNNISCSSTVFYVVGGMTLSFNITEMIDSWMYNDTNYVSDYKTPYGVLIKMDNESDSCTLYPNTVSNSKPYITINYKNCAFYSQKEGDNFTNSNTTTWYNSYFADISFSVGEGGETEFYEAVKKGGCYIMDFAMMLQNLGVSTEEPHTIGTLYVNQILPANPISVIFATHAFPTITNNVIQNTHDAMGTYREWIANAFGCTAGHNNVGNYTLSAKKNLLNTLLRAHPEGVIFRIPGEPDHYMLAMRKYDNVNHCYSDSEYFAVDPAKTTADQGFSVVLSTQATSPGTYVKLLSSADLFVYVNQN